MSLTLNCLYRWWPAFFKAIAMNRRWNNTRLSNFSFHDSASFTTPHLPLSLSRKVGLSALWGNGVIKCTHLDLCTISRNDLCIYIPTWADVKFNMFFVWYQNKSSSFSPSHSLAKYPWVTHRRNSSHGLSLTSYVWYIGFIGEAVGWGLCVMAVLD